MTDEQRAAVLIARRVITTLTTVALAPTAEEAEQAKSLYDAACRDWDQWRRPDRRLLPDWPAGPAGAVEYLQHMANL
jgi:hypothetical protein